MSAKDIAGAMKFALKAQRMYPSLQGLSHIMAVLDVHAAAKKKINGQTDWYGILQVDLVAEETVIRKQYRKLALMLHPDKNKCVGAEGAFKLIGEALGVLSDKLKRSVYDNQRNINGGCPRAKKRQRAPRKADPKKTRPKKPKADGVQKGASDSLFPGVNQASEKQSYRPKIEVT